MQVMSKSLSHILSAICLVWAMSACNSSANKDTKNVDNTKTEEKGVDVIPSTLENFDVTYYGLYKGQRTQMNLRRYGSALSGNWWVGDTTEVMLNGSLKGETNDFSLEATNKKGTQVGQLVGKFDANGMLRSMWKTDKDSLAIDFLPLARNVQVMRVRTEDLKLNKNSQNGKRQITISYPQLLGISDPETQKRVNYFIDQYFNADTWADSLEKGKNEFKEEVRPNDTYVSKEYISLCKHHHIDKNDGNAIFDDSHGITINYKRGKIYELRDLFKPNAIDALNKVILARINKSCGGALPSEVLDKCKVKGEEKNSFSILRNSVTFHLTERLPNDSRRGCGYVRIDCKELIDFINPSGPLSEHLPQKK